MRKFKDSLQFTGIVLLMVFHTITLCLFCFQKCWKCEKIKHITRLKLTKNKCLWICDKCNTL